MTTYVLDACAMLAVLSNESGADVVDDIYEKASSGDVGLAMNKLNLLEVYYDLLRTYGKDRPDEVLEEIRQLPIKFYSELTDEIFFEAGRLKTTYKISVADSIALAQAITINGTIVTADHHEFDVIEEKESIIIHWIR